VAKAKAKAGAKRGAAPGLDLGSPGFRRALLLCVLRNAPAAFALMDDCYRVAYVNDHLLRLQRLERRDVVGSICYDLLNRGEPCPVCPVREAMLDGGGHRAFRKNVLPDGSATYTDDFAAPAGGGLVMELQTDRTLEMQIKEKTSAMFLRVVDAMVRILEKKDSYTYAHSRDVGAISAKLTWYLGMGPQAVFDARLGGLLHDLGKLHVPDAVLNKNGRLDRWEAATIMEHPIFSYLILPDIEAFRIIREIAISHHEKWDGTGYPNSLQGEDIPLEARIAAVAATYSAMTSDRPYRKGLPHRVAMDEIERCAGTQFDPSVARAFALMVDQLSLDKDSLAAQDENMDFARSLNLDGQAREVGPSGLPGAPGRRGGLSEDEVADLAWAGGLAGMIMDNTPAHYMIVGEDYGVLWASDSLLLSGGVSMEDALRSKCHGLMGREDACFRTEGGQVRCPAARAFALGREQSGLVEDTVAGRTYHFATRAVPMELDGAGGGKVRCCFVVMHDQSKERQAQAKLEADLGAIVGVLYNLIAELDAADTKNMEGISSEAVSFNDYLNKLQAELAQMHGPGA
jgi:HD-GYP domain-containing protein (c-di-GMP phosphodiesterase class II)